jgi:hypothetical protein
MIIDHPDKEPTRTIVLSYSDSIRNGARSGLARSAPTESHRCRCIVLVSRLTREPRVPRARKLLLFGLVAYLHFRSISCPTSFQSLASSTM